ncbi:membrane protein [Thalassotalea loyana]|uniref:Membrane protein n=1 Tax=Thalassotalea loyana TaxID=280483 RepID=A0ABQ6HDI3_9GAMM|nr:DUF2069 domain-containing protein [Thalassotalea loyana]GLX85614.1 membrane protein [Thalassotalea loyana]
MAKQQKYNTSTYRKIALIGYFSLLIYMPLWLIFLTPEPSLSPTLTLVMFTLPLLFPLRGIVKGNPYTYAWSNFVVMIYFLHSLTSLWVSQDERLYAAIELIFASLMFYGGTYYAKYRGQELGLSIREKKADKAK